MAKIAKQSIGYLLRVYDFKLWERVIERSRMTGEPINKELEKAMYKYFPELPSQKKTKQ